MIWNWKDLEIFISKLKEKHHLWKESFISLLTPTENHLDLLQFEHNFPKEMLKPIKNLAWVMFVVHLFLSRQIESIICIKTISQEIHKMFLVDLNCKNSRMKRCVRCSFPFMMSCDGINTRITTRQNHLIVHYFSWEFEETMSTSMLYVLVWGFQSPSSRYRT